MKALLVTGTLLLLASSAVAAEKNPPNGTPEDFVKAQQAAVPDANKPVLTIEDGKKLYELGIKTGLAQAIVQAAQQNAKSALDKVQPQKP